METPPAAVVAGRPTRGRVGHGTRLRWPALILAACAIAAIGASHLYLGVHYPSDVAAAWTAALAWVVGLRLILGTARRARRAHQPSLSPPAHRRPLPVAHRRSAR